MFKNQSKPSYVAPEILLARKARPRASYLCQPIYGAINGRDPLVYPIVVDSEFYQPNFPTLNQPDEPVGRRGVSVQVGGLHGQPPVIFAHPDQVHYANKTNRVIRHPIFTSGFAPIDYLCYLGYEASIERHELGETIDLPRLQIVTYAFFAIAELFQIVQGDFITDVRDGLLDTSILMERRLRTRTRIPSRGKPFTQDYCPMPWVVTLDGYQYGVDWCIVDVGAIHGPASYKAFCTNCGLILAYKDTMKDGLITRMHETYFTHPTEFDAYALGDLEIYKAFVANAEIFRQIWKSLDIEAYYDGEPKLTIGATIQHLFEDMVLQLFEYCPR